ncbi:MAG: restriction endonuclease subunit S [Desulfocapsaceae bacterium]|nr:restriction endonuclease subunit S [Desulfocapsaceae bacterium]
MAEQTKMKVPQIRFKGHSDEWEEKTFGDLLPITSAARVHKNEWTKSGVPFFRSSDVVANYKGNENAKAFISFELYRELTGKTGRVEKGDILVTGGGSIGIPYLVNSDDPLYFKDADLLWLKVRENINSHYLYTYFSAQRFRRYLKSISHIGTIAHYTVEQAKSTPIGIPGNIDEQFKIGTYFQKLDQMIELHQRKHEKLVTLKKAMLKKMFPQNGATTPEIRFKGFSEPWEEKKIGEICDDTHGGGTPRTSEASFWNGGIDWIQSSDLTSDQLTNVAPRKSITENGLRASATKIIPENSIAIVTRVGVGKLALISHKYATSQDFLSLSKLRIDAWYALYSIWKTLQSKLHTVQGTSIKGLTKEELLSMQMLIPKQEAEQQKIGTYFRKMDELIAQHGTQVAKLKQIKTACLGKMFV